MRVIGVQLEETRRELRRQVEEREREVAAVKEELAESKRRRVAEMNEIRGQVEERERALAVEVAAVKSELMGVKGAMVDHKDAMTEKLDMAERSKETDQSEGDLKTAWERIKSATRATELSLENLNGLSDDILAHVSTMIHLKSINCTSASGFSAEAIKHLYRLTGLEKLDLDGTIVSDCALEGIGSLTSLKILYLINTNVTDAGLLHLTALSSLIELGLGGCTGVTNAGMVHVGRLTGLERFGVHNTAVTDDGLQQLTALTKLTKFWPPEGGCLENDDICKRIGR
ncbi:unnamed protein product [Closterium sp. Yama58-4]|nr:unnamed protein product [Closterium sp. Yama58-4]